MLFRQQADFSFVVSPTGRLQFCCFAYSQTLVLLFRLQADFSFVVSLTVRLKFCCFAYSQTLVLLFRLQSDFSFVVSPPSSGGSGIVRFWYSIVMVRVWKVYF